MPTDPHHRSKPEIGGIQPPPVIGYRAPELPPPVTRGERWVVIAGYLLLIAGFVLLLIAFTQQQLRDHEMTAIGVIVFVAGAVITVSCFIYNAIRRM